ncbi:MAG: cupin domain-containing protein [Xanthobacteraceae bacterium]
MDITRNGSQPSGKGPADWFIGAVRIDPLFEAPDPARARGASVTFEPGARTAWHTHPLGQTLIVTFGVGRVQRWGGTIEEIRPGDVVWFPPGEKHWHGASPATAMTHKTAPSRRSSIQPTPSSGWWRPAFCGSDLSPRRFSR